MGKISEIQEEEIVSILDGGIIVTKVDKMFYLVSKTGIQSERAIVKDLDLECVPSNKQDLFNMVSHIDPISSSFKTEINKEFINKRFVL